VTEALHRAAERLLRETLRAEKPPQARNPQCPIHAESAHCYARAFATLSSRMTTDLSQC